MDKTKLKNFAIYAREKLLEDGKNKAGLIGISSEKITPPLENSTKDLYLFDIGGDEPYKLTGEDISKYEKLVEEIQTRTKDTDYKTAYKTLMEEVAYTWFNRIIAIRFMEVNNYLPDNIRVLSSERPNVKEPDIVSQYEYTELSLTEKEKEEFGRLRFGSSQDTEELFEKLFIKISNHMGRYLPDLFEKTDDYAEILLRISYNDAEGVVRKLVDEVAEEDFNISINEDGESGQVEIIGWLYQYYNTERRDEVINVTAAKVVPKEDIGAATQLFTTDWVVRYMVDNSLGKYWLERNPDSSIKEKLKYLMPGEIKYVEEDISPEDIKILDNAMGSGHCLVYAFDILMEIYKSRGYRPREAARLIIEKNLYGLEIDKRAYQLSYFALMMKGREFDRSIFDRDIRLNLKVFQDSTSINREHLKYFGIDMKEAKKKIALEQINYLITEFQNSEELGSIIKLEEIDFELLGEFIDNYDENTLILETINIEKTQEQLVDIWERAKMLTEKYDILVTNPPYLNRMSPTLKKYVEKNYKDYKTDLFSVFIKNNIDMTKPKGYSAYMTPNVWMFIVSYEKLRRYLIEQKHIDSLIQVAKGAFFKEATVDVMTFVIKNELSKEKGKYIRLEDFKGDMEVQDKKTLEAIENPNCGYYYETDQNNFEKIPGSPIAYWASEKVNSSFQNKSLGELFEARQGMTTANNNKFLRFWHETNYFKIGFGLENLIDAKDSQMKWFPYNKGGSFKKWYGNNDYVVNYEDDGKEMKEYTSKLPQGTWVRLKSRDFYFKEAVTWTFISSSAFGVRYSPRGFIFDVAGSSIFPEDEVNYVLGFLTTKIAFKLLQLLNPTLNYQIKDVKALPIIFGEETLIEDIAKNNIDISKTDWDSLETSWDFTSNPLISTNESKISKAYENYKEITNSQFVKLKENEEELNRIFIEIYGLEDELTPEVSDKDITIAKIFDKKSEVYEDIKGNAYILTKEDVVKNLISYGVGCIFGRYSLDDGGLAFAGGEFDITKYKKFKPVEDNIVLISDMEIVHGDMVSKFEEFLKAAFGEEDFKENMDFIAGALGGKGDPRDTLRNYFVKNFFKDHVKTYKKRPIYWQYDSGKAGGFKALVYLHRIDRDTTGRVRTDYLHSVQNIFEARKSSNSDVMVIMDNAREKAKLEKENIELEKKLKEIRDYDKNIAVLSDMRIEIDLDDGVKVNYDKFQSDEKGKILRILTKY